MAYRRLVYANCTRGPKDTEAIHVRDVEKMAACTDEEILDTENLAEAMNKEFNSMKRTELLIDPRGCLALALWYNGSWIV